MDCQERTAGNGDELVRRLYRNAVTGRVPIYGGADLTWRCNLRCVHCYLGGASEGGRTGAKELTAVQWRRLIDEIADQGCMYFLMTGGEPLLRADFREIYRHAVEKGLLVTVFTNGTLVTKETLALFSDLRPRAVDISLYGATSRTYEAITGVKGSYERCLKGIEALLERGLEVKLKTVLMTFNRHEVYEIEQIAKALGCRFRFDAAIFPRLNGDKAPLALRVSPAEAVEVEMSDIKRRDDWRGLFERQKKVSPSEGLYSCGAGVTSFHVDPYGTLTPCLMMRDLSCSVKDGGFGAAWRDVMPHVRDKKPSEGYICTACEKRSLCGHCPPFVALETGDESGHSTYLCDIGELRFRAVMEN